MEIRVAVENGNDGRSLAWALDHPGCFIYGNDEGEVILNLPLAFLRYTEWIACHTRKSWLKSGNPDIRLVEVWQCYSINDEYQVADDGIEVNAWFRDDWRPLTLKEVERGNQLLTWSREDLLQSAQPLTSEQLTWNRPEFERWTIERILQHIANAEWWYLDRLGLAPWGKSDLPEDPFDRLAFVRNHVMQVLNELAGVDKVEGKAGEFWSPRKLLRRLLYHERDHIEHIMQILSECH